MNTLQEETREYLFCKPKGCSHDETLYYCLPWNVPNLTCFRNISKHKMVLDEFFRSAFRKNLMNQSPPCSRTSIPWTEYYNWKLPHRGYRNMGRCSTKTIELGKNGRKRQKKPLKPATKRKQTYGRDLTFTIKFYQYISRHSSHIAILIYLRTRKPLLFLVQKSKNRPHHLL